MAEVAEYGETDRFVVPGAADQLAAEGGAPGEARADLGDTLTKTVGNGARPPGRLEPGDARLTW